MRDLLEKQDFPTAADGETPEEPRFSALLRRLVFLLLLAAVVFSALIYPFRVPDVLLSHVDRWAEQGSPAGLFYFGQLRSQVAFNHSPLVYKECVTAGFLAAAVCAFLLLRVVSLAFGAGVSAPHRSGIRPLRKLFATPYPWLIALLVYCGATAMFLSPTFHYSLRTFLLFAFGIGSFIALVGIQPTRREFGVFVTSIITSGFIVALVAFMKHLDLAWWFLPAFDDPRNRLGSLIGHNTGVSSWLLFPLSFALAYLVAGNRNSLRGVCAVTAGLILFVIIAAQSRAIWLIAALVIPLLVRTLARCAGWRMKPRTALGGLAVIVALIAAQSVAPTVNPLARHRVSLVERVTKDFNPAQLLRETRLRILIVSLPLVAKSPLIGHGFGAFQYVYPPAHGEYFQRHPDSVLGTTPKRTDLAHNEYLQMFVECGAIGFLLLAIPLWMIVRQGWRRYRALPEGASRATFAALLYPMIAVAIHSFVDFPMHIIPIALVATYSLAFWSIGDTGLCESGCEDPVKSNLPDRDRPHSVRVRQVAALSAAGCMLLFSPLIYDFIFREFSSDILASDAANWSATARDIPESNPGPKYEALGFSRELYRRAIKLNVFNGRAMEGMAYTFSSTGRLDYTLWVSARDEGDARRAGIARTAGIRNYSSAVNCATALLEKGELRYHYTYYLIGQAYHMLWRLQPETTNYLLSAQRALQAAVNINNADVVSLFELADVVEHLAPPDTARAAALRRRIFDVDPVFGNRQFLEPAMETARRGNFVEAWEALAKADQAVGEHWRVKHARALVYLKEALWPPPAIDPLTTSPERAQWFRARHDLGKLLLEQATEAQPERGATDRLCLAYAAADHDYRKALRIADRLIRDNPADAELTVLRHEIAKRVGVQRDLGEVLPGGEEYWHLIQRLRTLLIGDVGLGSRQLARMATEPHVVLDIEESFRAIAFLRATGENDRVSRISQNLYRHHLGDPDVRKLLKELSESTGTATASHTVEADK